MIARPVHPEAVRELVAPAMQYATSDESLDVLLHSGQCWVIEEDGAPVAGWAQQQQGDCLHVLVYGGRAGVDLVRVLGACLEVQAPKAATFHTRRRGLMKKAQALGYRVVGQAPNGVIMRKDFK